MKKLFLTLALVAAGSFSYAQGTIGFANGTLTKVTMIDQNNVNLGAVPATAGLMNYGVFFGTTSTSLSLVPTLGSSTTAAAGIIGGNASATFGLPGTAGGDVVYLQVKGWTGTFGSDWATASATTGAYFGATDIRQVTLGPTAGPGAVIWQGTTGTNPNRFNPLVLNQVVPEPSTMALAGLGAAALLIFRRRK